MNFKMSTRSLKRLSRLTLVVDGPKDFIEKVETAIHSILAFPGPPPIIKDDPGLKDKYPEYPANSNFKLPRKTLSGPLLPVTDDDEATIPSQKNLDPTAKQFLSGGRFEPVAPGEVEKLRSI